MNDYYYIALLLLMLCLLGLTLRRIYSLEALYEHQKYVNDSYIEDIRDLQAEVRELRMFK